jgi:hypothetical protein
MQGLPECADVFARLPLACAESWASRSLPKVIGTAFARRSYFCLVQAWIENRRDTPLVEAVLPFAV